jgi:hypothetical protein
MHARAGLTYFVPTSSRDKHHNVPPKTNVAPVVQPKINPTPTLFKPPAMKAATDAATCTFHYEDGRREVFNLK